MKVVFFGTSNVALPILEYARKNHQVLAVVTSPDAQAGRKQEFAETPVSVLAKELGLNVLKPASLKNNPEIEERLKNFNADIFIVVSYGKILPENIINIPNLKTINIHFSLLPSLRGSSPIQHALLSGLEETGTTIFILEKGVDTGPILSQQKVAIEPDDNFVTLGLKLSKVSVTLLDQTLDSYQKNQIMPKPQNHNLATYTKIISKDDGKIDWNKPSKEIYNQFKAFYEWPGIWTTWRDKQVKILDCVSISKETGSIKPGTVMGLGLVCCGQNSALEIKTLQIAGKNPTDIASFLNGYPNFIGAELGLS